LGGRGEGGVFIWAIFFHLLLMVDCDLGILGGYLMAGFFKFFNISEIREPFICLIGKKLNKNLKNSKNFWIFL